MNPLHGLRARVHIVRRDAMLIGAAGLSAGIGFLVCLFLAGDPGWWGPLWALLLVAWTLLPGGALGAVLLPAAPIVWWWGVPEGSGSLSLLAALCLTVLLVVSALLSGAPDGVALARASIVSYARRSAIVIATTVVVWLLGQGLANATGEYPVLTTLAFALLAVSLLVTALHVRADPAKPSG